MHAINVDNVSFGYEPAVPVVRNVSLTVQTGEFLTFIGPNGSGKTTLLRLLDRILLPQRGTIMLDGQPLTRLARAAIARRIAFVPQDSAIQFPFSVEDVVLMGRAPHTRGLAFEKPADRERARVVMALTDITHLADHAITDLSGGERQRVLIARALAQEPGIILLDEPNAHLDIAHQIEVFTLLQRLNRDSHLTVVSVSHDLNLAAIFSERIAMMANGTLVAVGTPSEVLTESRINAVFKTSVLVDRHPLRNAPRISLPG
jgi:iron complex transport system ATP-binding protein